MLRENNIYETKLWILLIVHGVGDDEGDTFQV
jgi:hypothetical protein